MLKNNTISFAALLAWAISGTLLVDILWDDRLRMYEALIFSVTLVESLAITWLWYDDQVWAKACQERIDSTRRA